LLSATFSDYTPVTAMNIPDFLYGHMESPSPFTLNGAKGMGEGGAAPVHTICAALQDALYSQGVIIDDSHNTGDSLFRALQKAESGGYAGMVRVEHHRAAR
jgi:2-furoyl-CoA dehydrogenase large subunit